MGTKRVIVNLPEEEIQFLQNLAAENRSTFTASLNQAIRTEKFFKEQEDKGRKILIEEPSGKIREITKY